jgi:hypothetical protein
VYFGIEATQIAAMRQKQKQESSHIVRFTRAVPAYGGGFNFRHYVTLQQNGENVTCKAHDMAIRMLERHVILKGRRQERIWAVITQAIKDALWPEKATGCTSADQEMAFQWLAGAKAEALMEDVGINHEYAMWVIRQLVGDIGDTDDDAISQAIAG